MTRRRWGTARAGVATGALLAVVYVASAQVFAAPDAGTPVDAAPTTATATATDAGAVAANDEPEPAEATGAAASGKKTDAPAEGAEAAPPKAAPRFEQMRAAVGEQSVGARAMGLLGCLVCLLIALGMSRRRRNISGRIVAVGLMLQLGFAALLLKTEIGAAVFSTATRAITGLLSFSIDGSRFLFGNLVQPVAPVTQNGSPTGMIAETGSFLAFGVLPTILFFSALTAVLYHLGVLQRVVQVMAVVMVRLLGTSGAESLSASANIFVGQTEAPLVIRPYLAKMTQSELMAVMTGGFATVAGGVMAVYVGMLSGTFPDIAGHLLAASVMSAPASFVMAKIIVPETETPATLGGAPLEIADDDRNENVLDALAQGTTDGLMLTFNVGAMLITFVAMIAMINWCVGGVTGWFTDDPLTLENILGYALAPLAWCIGVPWEDAPLVGSFMGTKTVVNEFIAYQGLAAAMANNEIAHPKSVVIATYALCGFSNLGSIGIQIGGLAAMAPERRGDLARLAFPAMIAASLACFQTAAIAGMLL